MEQADLIRMAERFANPPIMMVETKPEAVRDAERWREFTAKPWWRRLWKALNPNPSQP